MAGTKGNLDCVAIVCVGRLMFSEMGRNLFDSMMKFGMPIVMNQSPYWEQSIQRAIEQAIREYEPKYLLFFDGDSAWEPSDLKILRHLIEGNDSIDAIVPVQADRNSNKPLAYNWLAEQGIKYDYTKPLTQIIHGHFGMTFIRTSAIQKMKKPWFWGTPGDDGSWDLVPGKRDPDTNFWIKFHETGLKVVQSNHTIVGHMEIHVRWQSGQDIVVQTPMEYQRDGKPYGLRSPTQKELGIEMPVPQRPPGTGPETMPPHAPAPSAATADGVPPAPSLVVQEVTA